MWLCQRWRRSLTTTMPTVLGGESWQHHRIDSDLEFGHWKLDLGAISPTAVLRFVHEELVSRSLLEEYGLGTALGGRGRETSVF